MASARAGCTAATVNVELLLPVGFQDQLNDVVRAVLYCQPAACHICTFVADFLDAQVDDRTQLELGGRLPTSHTR